MNSTIHAPVLSLDEAAAFSPQQIVDLARSQLILSREVEALKHQLDWFKRQLFGQKSERRIVDGPSGQMNLGEAIDQGQAAPPAGRPVAAHTRRPTTKKPDTGDDAVPFFDATPVPIEVIDLAAPEAAELAPEDCEVIGHKESYRLAQRPGSYVVLKYRRPVIKVKATQAIACPSAPAGVIEGSRADVSFVARLLIDKFAYHLPLYRQHQRLGDAGITVSRPWLTQLAQQGAALLEPIYDAQFASIRASRVKAMDETPIKAGRAGPGKLNAAYFWPRLWSVGRSVLPVLRKPRCRTRRTGPRPHPCRGRRPALGRLQRLRPLREQDRADSCPMLGAYTPQAVRGARRRTAGGGVGTGPDRWPVCGGNPHPQPKAQHSQETRLSIDPRQTDRRTVLRLGGAAVRGAGLVTEQSSDQGLDLCPRATMRLGGLSDRPGCSN